MSLLSNQKLGKILHDLTDGLHETKVDQALEHFVHFLNNNKAINKIDDIILEYEIHKREQRGIIPAEVITAHDVGNNIDKKIKEAFGDNLEITHKVDPEIIGGVKIRIGNKIFDGSTATQIKSLKQTLSE